MEQVRRAVIVVDMLNDNVHTNQHLAIAVEAGKIIPGIQRLLAVARQRGEEVIYACDSFEPDDFMFTGRMRPHSLRGTSGAEVIPELAPQPGELVLPKRSFGAFWQTDLAEYLCQRQVKEVLLAGISTPVCVMGSAVEAVASGFRATVIGDCCASSKPEIHRQTLEVYRECGMYPLLRIETLDEYLQGLAWAE